MWPVLFCFAFIQFINGDDLNTLNSIDMANIYKAV